MSGGHFDYVDGRLMDELFGWTGADITTRRRNAILKNPMQDPLVSALTYDLLCLIGTLDYTLSGDYAEDTYSKELE